MAPPARLPRYRTGNRDLDAKIADLLDDSRRRPRPRPALRDHRDRGAPRRRRRRSPRPEDHERRAEGDAGRVPHVRAVPRHPEGHDLRLGPHPSRRSALRAGPQHRQGRSPTHGWMVVTGAGPGIMAAGMEGAGRDMSFGVSIRLPFENEPNPIIAGDTKLVSMKYFFTRKLMLMKESRGVRVPARRLRHARRGVRAAHARADGQVDARADRDARRPERHLLDALARVRRRRARRARS